MSLLFLNKKEKKRKNDGHYTVTHISIDTKRNK